MSNRRNFTPVSTNKSAVIRSRIDRTGKARTETARRSDTTFTAAVSTDERLNSTNLYLDFNEYGDDQRPDQTVVLDGRQARTLYRLLARHYGFTNKSLS